MVQITTDSQGRFSTELSDLSVGGHTITIEYAGDDKYTSSSVTRLITVSEHIYAIDLYSNNPEIETGDSTSVIATLTDDNIPVSDETLSYTIKHGSTTITTGTGTTNNNGQITINYTGTGAGDIDIVVTFDTITETYEITDYWKIYLNEFTNTDFNNAIQQLNFTLPSGDFEIIWEASSDRSGSNNNYIRIGADDNNCILFGVIDGNQTLGYYIRENGSYTHQTRGTVTGSVNSYMEHKITVVNGVITYNTANLILPSNTVSLETFLSRTVWYGKSRNIKIKAL